MEVEDTADPSRIDDDMGHDTAARLRAEAATAEVLQRHRTGNRLDYETRFGLLAAIIDDDDLPSAAIKAARVIIAHHNHRDGYAFPGIDTIAAGMRRSRTQAKSAVKALVDAGWFRVEVERRGNRNGPNRYFPNLAKIDLTGRKTDPSEIMTGRISDVDGSENRRFTGRKTNVSRVGNPPPNPVDLTQKKEPREDNPASFAHAREGRPEVSSDWDRSRPDARTPLPSDFKFPAESEAAARARGLNDADIARGLDGFRELVGKDQRTLARWSKSGGAYLAQVEAQREDEPRPGDWVRLLDGRHVRRSWAKAYDIFTDSAGNRWSGADANGNRKMTPQVTDYRRPVAASVPGAVKMDDWQPPADLFKLAVGVKMGEVNAEGTLQRFRATFGPHHCVDPDHAFRQWLGLIPKPNIPASKNPPQSKTSL